MKLCQQLKSDLLDKLEQWGLALEQPTLCIEGYFSELTYEIDLITENALSALANMPEGDDQSQTINGNRVDILEELKECRESLVDRVIILETNAIWEESRRVFEQVGRDIEALSPEMADLEDRYLKLALTMLVQKSVLEDQALGNDLPVLYTDPISGRPILVSLNGVSFSVFDLFCFKCLLVPLHKPFEIDAYMMLTKPFTRFISDVLESVPQKPIVRVGASLSAAVLPGPLCFDGSIVRPDNESSPTFARLIETLDLSINCLYDFDYEYFRSLKSLKKLRLKNEFNPGTRLEHLKATLKIDFLNCLVSLTELKLIDPVTFVSNYSRTPTPGLSVIWVSSASTSERNLDKTVMNDSLMSRIFCYQLTELKLCGMKLGSSGHLNQLPGFLGRFAALVKSLDLGKNGLTSLPDGSFEKLTSLESLDLSWNKLASLPENFLNSLSQLKQLNLSGNAINDLPAGIFDNLNCITDLDLSDNKLTRVSRNIFSHTERTQKLKLSNNPIAQLDADVFLDMKQLRVLDLSHCQLNTVRAEHFSEMNDLRTLDLSHNQIETILFEVDDSHEPIAINNSILTSEQVALVKNLLHQTNSSLNHVKLNNNQLVEFNLILFNNVRNRLQVDLSNNKLARIGNQLDEARSHVVERLDLSGNQLETLPDGFFRRFERLTHLNLENNGLELTIDSATFSSRQLMELNLLRNKAIEIDHSAWEHLRNIESLRLDIAPPSLLESQPALDQLRHLTIHNSDQDIVEGIVASRSSFLAKLLSVDFSDCSLTSLSSLSLGRRCPKLQTILLSGNVLSVIKPKWFANLTDLKVLDLSRNGIESLDDVNTFASCSALEHLKLNDNQINHIDTDLFESISRLQRLDLSNNRLSSIGVNELNFLGNLKCLILSGNGITQFRVETVCRKMKHLNQLDLSNNQLDDLSINETSFQGLDLRNSLRQLNLANNQLTSLAFVHHLERLEELNVSFNNIETIYDINGNHLFPDLVSLKHLNLLGNRLQQINSEDLIFGIEFLQISN